ncbi:hypothetical protein FUAX_08420 [Fulvitalea axinellae]|uniref:AtpZ/AtpI family protein n=1 Tax=Fulvitalea axinellae TaxID=1182444 RepID=A0AAU9DC53_9BACT|nr:hypothetical protein FUAX_08420 [Fulvitalea axinellae]
MPRQKSGKGNWRKHSAGYAKYSGLAVQMGATLFICYWIGAKIDEWAGGGRLFTILLTVLGVLGVIYSLIRSLTKDIDDDGKENT